MVMSLRAQPSSLLGSGSLKVCGLRLPDLAAVIVVGVRLFLLIDVPMAMLDQHSVVTTEVPKIADQISCIAEVGSCVPKALNHRRPPYLGLGDDSEPSLKIPGIIISLIFSEQRKLVFRATPLQN